MCTCYEQDLAPIASLWEVIKDGIDQMYGSRVYDDCNDWIRPEEQKRLCYSYAHVEPCIIIWRQLTGRIGTALADDTPLLHKSASKTIAP